MLWFRPRGRVHAIEIERNPIDRGLGMIGEFEWGTVYGDGATAVEVVVVQK